MEPRETTLQEHLVIRERDSAQAEVDGIIVSAAETFSDRAKLVVGRPGLPNIEETLSVGGAVLFETPDGLFEVRVMKTTGAEVTVLISHVAPRPGLAGGFVDQDQDNAPFTSEELTKIRGSIQRIRPRGRAEGSGLASSIRMPGQSRAGDITITCSSNGEGQA